MGDSTVIKKHWPAVGILVAYLIVGTFFAALTPRWQVPDEPAHYNYIAALAQGKGFPVMEARDYDQKYLERLTAERFPPSLPTDSLAYEDHQPPLYYLLATPIFLIFNGALLPLRLFSLLLGGVIVALTMALAHEVLPHSPGIAWLAGGFVAFLPQHLAMMAGVNNDSLTEALLALWLLLALRYLRGKVSPYVLGAVLGALLITKTTGYVALPLAVLVVALRWRRGGFSWRWALTQLLQILIPGLALGSLWWIRNLLTYGWPDFLGLRRHDLVVVGQPRTADWIARQGLWPFLRGALRTTFQSFWGQFGWMGVVLDARIYLGAGIFTALALWGALWLGVRVAKEGLEPRQRDALILLGASALITLALPIWYNLTYVQHQARYLFPALPIFALVAALGLRRLAEVRLAVLTGLGLIVVVILVGGMGWLRGDLPLWTMALLGAAAIAVWIAGALPNGRKTLAGGVLLLAFIALDFWCLFGFIVPMLG